MTFRLLKSFGGQGTGPGLFSAAPTSLAFDSRGRLLISSGSSVQTFAPDFAPLSRWSTTSPAHSLAVATDGRVFTGHEGSVAIHEPAGRLLQTWSDPPRLARVTSIALSRDSAYLADAQARLIRRFSLAGKFLNDIGGDNPTHGFLIPNGVLACAADAQGVLHAANPAKHRIERYSPDGKLLSKTGRFDQLDPAGFPGCCNPCTFALDASGNLYLTEKAPPRAKTLSPEGRLRSVIATSLLDPLARNCPIAVDSRGRVFLADPVRFLIHAFEVAP